MAVAKSRGVIMGDPRPADSLARGRETIAAQLAAHRESWQPLIVQLRESGLSLRAIAGEINRRGIKTVWETQGCGPYQESCPQPQSSAFMLLHTALSPVTKADRPLYTMTKQCSERSPYSHDSS